MTQLEFSIVLEHIHSRMMSTRDLRYGEGGESVRVLDDKKPLGPTQWIASSHKFIQPPASIIAFDDGLLEIVPSPRIRGLEILRTKDFELPLPN